jgi:hypothetical protein
VLAHAILGAAVAAAGGNNALTAGLAAGGAEAAAPALSKWLYGTDDPEKLTAQQKATIGTIAGLAGNAVGGVAGSTPADSVAGGMAARNAVDNNAQLNKEAIKFLRDKDLVERYIAFVKEKQGRTLTEQDAQRELDRYGAAMADTQWEARNVRTDEDKALYANARGFIGEEARRATYIDGDGVVHSLFNYSEESRQDPTQNVRWFFSSEEWDDGSRVWKDPDVAQFMENNRAETASSLPEISNQHYKGKLAGLEAAGGTSFLWQLAEGIITLPSNLRDLSWSGVSTIFSSNEAGPVDHFSVMSDYEHLLIATGYPYEAGYVNGVSQVEQGRLFGTLILGAKLPSTVAKAQAVNEMKLLPRLEGQTVSEVRQIAAKEALIKFSLNRGNSL